MLTAHTARHSSGRAEVTAYQDVHDGRCVLYARGVFDMATTGVLDEAMGRARVPHIVIDCSAVTFADLAFLRALSGSGSQESQDMRIDVVAPSLAVRRLLDATATTSRFLAAGHSRSVSWSAPARTPCAPAN